MSCSFMNISFGPKALPSLPLLHGKVQKSLIPQKASKGTNLKAIESLASSKSSVAIQVGTLLTAVGAEPALAVTGVNNEEDLIWVLIQLAISAFFYFLVCPGNLYCNADQPDMGKASFHLCPTGDGMPLLGVTYTHPLSGRYSYQPRGGKDAQKGALTTQSSLNNQ